MKPLLSYEQVRLYPNKFDGVSRSEGDTSIVLGKHRFTLPVMPSNMKCTIDIKNAHLLSESGHFYVMHRFGPTAPFVIRANQDNWRIVSISVGIKDADRDMLSLLKNQRIDYITIDVAHGFCEGVGTMLAFLRNEFPNTFIIAGNVCDRSAALQLQSWGAQAVKVGIAQGAACTTYGKTGFGIPMFSCVRDIAYDKDIEGFETRISLLDIPIIADGGFRTNGDIAKAIVAGADMCMIGSMFAALKDSPAELVARGVQGMFKKYYGSASRENGNTKNIEGTVVLLPLDNRTYQEKLTEIKQDLQSAISYAGGKDLNAFRRVRYGFTY